MRFIATPALLLLSLLSLRAAPLILEQSAAPEPVPLAVLTPMLVESMKSDLFWPYLRLWLEMAALAAGGDPAIFALTVAISTSNSFLIPTHQVNALIMGPAGYKVIDFMRTGGIMTILFLVVSLGVMNLVY